MPFPVYSEWAGAFACFGLVWGVLSTLLWLGIVLKVVAALNGLARAHAELANALDRIAERMPVKEPGPADMDWRTDQPPPRVVEEG